VKYALNLHLKPLRQLPHQNFLLESLVKKHYVSFTLLLLITQFEAIPESLKNMLLVMDTAGIFHSAETASGYTSLWDVTWERIDCFLPNLKNEVFKPPSPGTALVVIACTSKSQEYVVVVSVAVVFMSRGHRLMSRSKILILLTSVYLIHLP